MLRIRLKYLKDINNHLWSTKRNLKKLSIFLENIYKKRKLVTKINENIFL